MGSKLCTTFLKIAKHAVRLRFGCGLFFNLLMFSTVLKLFWFFLSLFMAENILYKPAVKDCIKKYNNLGQIATFFANYVNVL